MRASSQEDFLLRQIRQAIEAIARAMGLKGAGKLEEAKEELGAAAAELLGPVAPLALHVDVTTAAHLIGDAGRIDALAKLLVAEAELYEVAGDATAAARATERARGLVAEAERRRERPTRE
jgi:hypothetical protein